MKKLLNDLGKNRGYFLLTLIVGIVFSGISILTPTVSGNMITAFTKNVSDGTRYLILLVICGGVQILLYLADSYFGLQFNLRQKKTMRKNAFRSFLKKDTASREEISEFTSFVNNDIPSVSEQYFSGTIDIIKCVFILLFSAVSMLAVHWLLALIVFAVSGIIVLCPKTAQKKVGRAREAYSEALGKYNIGLQSFLGGLRIVRSYGYYGRAASIQDEADNAVAKKEKGLIRCQMTVRGLTGILQVVKTLLILIVGVILISLGQTEIGGLVAVVQLAEIISVPAEVLAYMIHSRNEVLPLLEKYEKITSPENKKASKTPLSGHVENITVSGLSYSVNGLSVLRDVNVTFEAGKNYLISGESGSGKSTLMRLIAGIGDTEYSGKILCNGKDVRKLSAETYYRRVCPVFQEPYLFCATLEENILLGRDIPQDVYDSVMKKLNLEYLTARYAGKEMSQQTVEQLSGGEKQRVALARAMVGKPEVYLLDEVTSALDAKNSAEIEEILLRENAAVVHICHKPNEKLASLYDRMFVMKNGKLYLEATSSNE